MTRLSVVALAAAFAVSRVKGGCDDDTIFFQGVLDGIHLVADESMELQLEIDNGVYAYCRVLDLQSGDLSFEEVSCSGRRDWEAIPSYNIDVTPSDNSTVDIVFGNDSVTLDLSDGDDVYIDSDDFAYFYSPSMMTLFIFTTDGTEWDDDSSTLNLVSISWDSVDGDFPDNLTDFQYVVQSDIIVDSATFPTTFPTPKLDGALWRNYDADDMFMVEVVPMYGDDYECSGGNPWVRYSFLEDLYQEMDDGGNTTMQFDYVGNGFVGVDTRIQRAFGFNAVTNDVWYYEADGDEFDEWRTESFGFGDAELTSYWVVMFAAIALFVLYCCCCVCCVYRSRARKSRRKGTYDTTRDTELFSTYV